MLRHAMAPASLDSDVHERLLARALWATDLEPNAHESSDVSLDPSREARLAALRAGRYGRCIYRCDNDVLDHQTVSVEFASGVTASFGLHGFANEERRTV